MAVEVTTDCVKCGHEFTFIQVRKPRKYCFDCTGKPQKTKIQKPVKHCKWCLAPMQSKRQRGRVYCSDQCRESAGLERRRHVCEFCETPYLCKDRKAKRFCSRECAWLSQIDESSEERKAKLKAAKKLIKGEISALKSIARKAKRRSRQSLIYQRTCEGCGIKIKTKRSMGKPSNHCDSCTKARQRAHRLKAKAKRRGVTKLRAVDPFIIFQRDRWTCCACRCSTPKHLRGTHEDNAPELDHVIPVSAGGAHRKDNLQTLCRLCNMLKRDMPMGEYLKQYC